MTGMAVTVLVVAKAPIAGFAKTRLTPPLSPRAAADLASAALLDTLAAVRDSGAARATVAWTGDVARAERAGAIAAALQDFEVVPQRGQGFGTRLANAHADAARSGLPVLQIGMDTPQAGPELLAQCAARLLASQDAVLGPATDGGWWALGLTDPRVARVLTDVPMSTERTDILTREALSRNGCRIEFLTELNDVDHFGDIAEVAADCTGLFASAARLVAAVTDTGR